MRKGKIKILRLKPFIILNHPTAQNDEWGVIKQIKRKFWLLSEIKKDYWFFLIVAKIPREFAINRR